MKQIGEHLVQVVDLMIDNSRRQRADAASAAAGSQ
jgi:hypothetical protein